MKERIFYYHFDWLNIWFILNAVLTILFVDCAVTSPCMFFYYQTYFIFAALWLSVAMWGYKHFGTIQAVLINDEGIKIDHSELLPWKDIAAAEEKDVMCCFKMRRVISLVPKEGIQYHYNFLQKHNCFPPFSVPMYGILTPADEDELWKLIDSKIAIKKL